MIHSEQIGFIDAILLGVLQGLIEWLPVSSEGIISVIYSIAFDRPFSEALAFALWLHIGTAFSATVAFRKTILELLRDLLATGKPKSTLLPYLLISSTFSGIIGLPLFLLVGNIQNYFGAAGMGLVGILMIVTGITLIRKPKASLNSRCITSVSNMDGMTAGIAQGLAVMPGLSRSGLTVAVLLSRNIHQKSALTLSFIMSIPASIGIAAYVGFNERLVISVEGILAGLVAFIVGLLSINGILAIVQRIKVGIFVLVIGASMIIGSLLLQI